MRKAPAPVPRRPLGIRDIAPESVLVLAGGRAILLQLANPAVGHAAAAVPNHLSAEVQDLGAPFGVTIAEHYADGGIVLGDEPGAGVDVDEVAIAANQRDAPWITPEGPHVRSQRAGLRLVAGEPTERGN